MSHSPIESPDSVLGSTHGTNRHSFKSDMDDNMSERTPLIVRTPQGQIIAPKDKWNLVRWSFLYLGMITMLPWNIMLSIPSFWDYKFRNVTLDHLNSTANEQSGFWGDKPTEMQLTFPSYLSIASNVPGALTTIMHSLLGQRACVRKRIFWSLAIFFASFGGLLLLSLPNSDKWQDRYLHTVILMVVLLNVGVNVLQGALFGVSGRFPSIYAGCVMTGQSLGGVLPAIAAILLTVFDVEPIILGPVCFCLILASILAAVVIFFGMSNNIFFLYHGEGKVSVDQDIDHNDEVDHICYKAIFKNSWMYFITGYINYATTLSVFPAITSLVRSQVQSHWTRQFFTPVASVLLFNVGDLIGRTSATWLKWPGTKRFEQFTLMSVTVLRIGTVFKKEPRQLSAIHSTSMNTLLTKKTMFFLGPAFNEHFFAALVPCVMLCNVDIAIRRDLPTIFHGDVTFCFYVLCLGISNGYIGNVVMLMIPKVNEAATQMQFAATLMNSAIVLGIASGSTAGYFLKEDL